jgi:hypothetical protein
MKILVIAFSACLFTGALSAQLPTVKAIDNFNDPVATGNKTTYADLIRIMCPGLQVDAAKPSEATASGCAPHRVMESGMTASTWEGVAFTKLSQIPVKTLGPDRILLSFEGGDFTRALGVALFQIRPRPKLLDVIETTGAPDCAPSLYFTLPLADGAQAFGFGSAHGNVGWVDQQITFVSLRDNHLEKVNSFFVKSCSRTAFGAPEGCERGDVECELDAVNPAGVLQLRITEKRRTTRTYTAAYQWDPARKRYLATSNALAAFAEADR